MSNVFIFFQNREIKAIYNDEKKLKKDVIKHIVNFYIEENVYSDTTSAIKKLKSKFKSFFQEEHYFLEHMNNTWSLTKIELNTIMSEIKSTVYRSKYTKINVKAQNCVRRDLSRDLSYLPLEAVYVE